LDHKDLLVNTVRQAKRVIKEKSDQWVCRESKVNVEKSDLGANVVKKVKRETSVNVVKKVIQESMAKREMLENVVRRESKVTEEKSDLRVNVVKLAQLDRWDQKA
jgi:hypothetical protein